MLLAIAIFAGFFAGLSACLIYLAFHLAKQLSKSESERKRWINKALIRDGQAKIFSESDIEPNIETEKAEKRPPTVIRSPFQKGKVDLIDKIASERENPGAANLPDVLKQKIQKDVEAVTNA